MPDPTMLREHAEAFAKAMQDLKTACDKMGIEVSALGFPTGWARNRVSDQMVLMHGLGVPWFVDNVRIVDNGNVTICGAHLVVQWRR